MNKSNKTGPNKHITLLMRVGVWGIALLGLLGVLAGVRVGMKQVFFSNNPHFSLKKIDVNLVTGDLDEAYVLKLVGLDTEGSNPSNIQEEDLARLRDRILQDPLIREVEVRRIIPDTLALTVYARTPVAQLVRPGGLLIDREGVVLPPSSKTESYMLPLITPVPGLAEQRHGIRLENKMVHKALELLACREHVKNGLWMDIKRIQLYSDTELRTCLRAREDCFIQDDATIYFPTKDIRQAVEKVVDILEERQRARQPVGHINATYKNRIPVTP